MAYSEKEKKKILSEICDKITEGASVRKSIKEAGISFSTFYIWLEEDDSKSKQYAYACDIRGEAMFEEIIDIADDSSNDKIYTEGGEKTNTEAINRSRLRVDTRKWYLSKIKPKKYGDKLDLTTDGDKINGSVPISKWIEDNTEEND